MKNINIKLTEKEQDIIDFLEDKPLKYIFVEAVTMYMNAYNNMLLNNTNSKDPQLESKQKLEKFMKM